MRHVVRRLIQQPLFTAIAVLTLAVGIGANASIFSVVNGVLLKPLPYSDADRLIDVDHVALGLGIKSAGAAPFLYFTYKDGARSMQDIGLWRGNTVSITGRAEPEEIDSVDITASVLAAFRVQPALGRVFSTADDVPDAPLTAVPMNGYWRSKFGGDPSVVGQQLTINGRRHEIIGVLPERFQFLDRKPALLLPM